MKRHKLFILFISVSLIISFFVSCAIESTSPRGEDNFADDEMVVPFERIDLGNSEYIAFYEPDPGDFLMFCAFNSDDKAKLQHTLTGTGWLRLFQGQYPEMA